MIVKDWFEGIIQEYDDILARNGQTTKTDGTDPKDDNSGDVQGSNWSLYLAGAAVIAAGGYLAFNMMNKAKVSN